MTTLSEIQITASLDDAIGAGTDRNGTGTYAGTGTVLYLGADWSYFRCAGFRFPIPIPKNATINSAILALLAYEAASNAFDVTIHGQSIGNAPAFPAAESTDTTSGSPGYRTRTSASDRWYSGTGLTSWTAGNWYGASVVNSLQEMVNHADWAANNYGVFLMLNTGSSLGDLRRKVYMSGQGVGYGAKLSGTYTVSGGAKLFHAHLITQEMI